MRRSVKIFLAAADIFLLFICFLLAFYSITLPDSYYTHKGSELSLSCYFKVTPEKSETTMQSLKSENEKIGQKTTLKLFGIIPIKEVFIEEVDTPLLIPCGEPFGIKLLSEGVMIVGISDVKTENGTFSPARYSGLSEGDIIISIDGKTVSSNSDVSNIISESNGRTLEIVATRDNQTMHLLLTPVYSKVTNLYQAGMWVRDSTAGIGTITYYDAQTGCFGGLGHPVCDVDTGNIIPLSSGKVCSVTITDVVKGESGVPGELCGCFSEPGNFGTLDANTTSGVFGILSSNPSDNKAIPMAMRQEIHTGEAYILSTVDGSSPKKYDIQIEKIDMKNSENGKNMVIRITDTELLSRTGGIVQGMSGSPIIQDDKIIGAVTHVFVNDPTKGYGIFIDEMYSVMEEEMAA